MLMFDIDRIWARISQRTEFRGKQLADYMYQGVTYTAQLTSTQALTGQPVNFPSGAVIVAGIAGAQLNGVAGTQTGRQGLDMFAVAISDGSNNRAIVGTAQAIAASVYGHYGDQWPAREIVIPVNGSLLYSITNLTTSTINVYVTHHCLVPAAVG